jgi:hypothetical protein
METNIHLWHHIDFFLEWDMFQSCRKIQNTYCMFSNIFFKEKRAVYEIRSKSILETDRS